MVKLKKKNILIKNFINDIGCVIFDEVHYINDKSRGHVWEETIILLNRNITLVMLSATIDKPEEFASWIGDNKQKTINLIPTNHRVVPLEHFVYKDEQLDKILTYDNKFQNNNYDNVLKYYDKLDEERFRMHKNKLFLLDQSVKFLKNNNMLQAIYFSFSRKNCEKYAKMITTELISSDERAEIIRIYNKYMHTYDKEYAGIEQFYTIKNLIAKGVAYHHSGLIPILKEIVEIIFQKGLIKVLFATETFSVGVNMPTRTIVFTEFEKYTDGKKRFLNTSEYKTNEW